MGVKLVRFAESNRDFNGKVVDVLDATDPYLNFMEGALLRETGSKGSGAMKSDTRIFVHDKPHAIGYVVEEILGYSAVNGKIGLIRFHGHGAPGYQGVCSKIMSSYLANLNINLGLKSLQEIAAEQKAEQRNRTSTVAISNWNLGAIGSDLKSLKPVFSDNAEVWLMGCNVGARKSGRQLVNSLAQLLDVTVKAGSETQTAGDTANLARENFFHEGPIVVGNPSG